MVMKLAEDEATFGAPSAIFDMKQFVTFETLTCSKRSITYVTWKRGFWNVFGGFFLLCGNRSTDVTARWVFMKLFMFHKLRGMTELLTTKLTHITNEWCKNRSQTHGRNH